MCIRDSFCNALGIQIAEENGGFSVTRKKAEQPAAETKEQTGKIALTPYNFGDYFSYSVRETNVKMTGMQVSGDGFFPGKMCIRDRLKVVHMGDQGCMPDETVMQAILDADVMMIPVGGFYTIDAKGAKAIIEQARPKCVIPMHYKTCLLYTSRCV